MTYLNINCPFYMDPDLTNIILERKFNIQFIFGQNEKFLFRIFQVIYIYICLLLTASFSKYNYISPLNTLIFHF